MINGIINQVLSIFKNKSNKQLFKNILIVGVITLLIKGISFYKEILIAKNYGVSELLDTFFIAVLIPAFIQGVFINSYSKVFIPNYLKELKQNKNIKAFQTSSFIITISIALFFIVLTFLLIDFYLEILFPGHTEDYYQLIKKQLWIILPCMLFWAITSLISGLLKISDEFLFSTIEALFIPISMIGSLLFLQNELQEQTLAAGMLIGSAISTIYLIIVSSNKKLLNLGLPDFKSANIKILIKQIPAKVSSGLINGINPIVDQYFSAQMIVGSIAALNYGLKIPAVVIGLMSISIGSVILPYFSKLANESQEKSFDNLKKMLLTSFILTSTLTFIIILLSKPIIAIAFERNAFTSKDTLIVYVIQQMYLIQVPFYIVGTIMNNYLTAINKNSFLVISSSISMGLNILFNFIFIKFMGIKGLALATSLVSLVNSIVIYIYIRQIYRHKYV